jgi:phage terminase large subunit-like protein
MARDLQKEVATKFYEFSQGSLRSVADQQLHTMIIHRRVLHDGNQILRRHVDNAAAKTSGEKLRFVKPDTNEQFGRTKRPIDALVSTSMGAYKCLKLIL